MVGNICKVCLGKGVMPVRQFHLAECGDCSGTGVHEVPVIVKKSQKINSDKVIITDVEILGKKLPKDKVLTVHEMQLDEIKNETTS